MTKLMDQVLLEVLSRYLKAEREIGNGEHGVTDILYLMKPNTFGDDIKDSQ